MKKLIFTTLTSFAIMSAFAQEAPSTRLIHNPNPATTTVKAIPSTKTLNNFNSGVFGKSGPLSQWFSNESHLVNYGTQIDNGSGNPTPGTYRLNYNFIANDTFAKYAYFDPATSTQKVVNASYMHNLGFLFDGRSIYYDAFPTTTPPSTLSSFTPYSIDSMAVNYIYERFCTDPNVVDTLLFQIFYPNWTSNDTVQNSPIIDVWYSPPSTEAIATMDYNPITNLGTLKNGTSGNVITVKVPLNITDSCLANADGSINVKTKMFAVTPTLSLQRRTRFAVTYKFNPATPYGVGDTINGDTAAMKLVAKRNNSFRGSVISDYSSFNEGLNTVQPFVDRIYNLGLLARTETRYTYTGSNGFPSNSVFYKRYYSAGFQTSTGVTLNIYPNIAAHITNVTNSGINEVKNSNLIASAVYPNPATINGIATLEFNLKSSSKVSVEIYNLMGQLVKTVANKNFDSGVNTLDMNLSGMNAGVYFVDVNVNGVSQTKKLTIVQ